MDVETIAEILSIVGVVAGALVWFLNVTVVKSLRARIDCIYSYLAERHNDVVDRSNALSQRVFTDNGRTPSLPHIPLKGPPYCPKV